MDIPENEAQQVKGLVADTPCSKGHDCLNLPPGTLCKAKFGTGRRVLFCLDENSQACGYSTTFAYGVLCTCAVRQYIAQHLHR